MRPIERIRQPLLPPGHGGGQAGRTVQGVRRPGRESISIASMIQKGRDEAAAVPIVMLTHVAVEGDMRRSLQRINALDVIAQDTVCIRVEGAED